MAGDGRRGRLRYSQRAGGFSPIEDDGRGGTLS